MHKEKDGFYGTMPRMKTIQDYPTNDYQIIDKEKLE